MIETSISIPNFLFYDCDADISVYVNKDVSDYKIRAEIINQLSTTVTLSNLSDGGSDDEIEFEDDGEDGKFIIHIAKDTISSPVYLSYLYIEIEDDDGKISPVYYGLLPFKNHS